MLDIKQSLNRVNPTASATTTYRKLKNMISWKKRPNKLVILALVAVAVIAGISFSDKFTNKNQEVQEVETFQTETESKPSSISYEATENDQNAFELLKQNAEIEYKEYDFGVFVESIDGVKSDDKNFWSLYINGEKSQTGADQTILEKGDKVEWRYEEIEY